MTSNIAKRCRNWPASLVLAAFLFCVPSVAKPQSHPSGDQTIEAQGLKLVQQGRVQEAIETFKRGVRSDPKNPYLLNALGASFSLLGEEENAQQCFLKTLSDDPDFLPARKNLAISYFKSGNYGLASAELQKLAASPLAKPMADLFLGLIAEKAKRYPQAVKLLGDAGPVALEEPEGVLALAQSLYEIREPQQALAALRKASRNLRRAGHGSLSCGPPRLPAWAVSEGLKTIRMGDAGASKAGWN